MMPRIHSPGRAHLPMPIPTVTFETVSRDIVSPAGQAAESELEAWRRQRPDTAPTLSGFIHRRIFGVRPSEVDPLLSPPIENWPFPKGVRKADWSLRQVDDMTTGIPLCLALHWCVEETGRLPSWKDAAAWMNTPKMIPHFLRPAWKLYKSLPAAGKPSKRQWENALRWRLGNAYLSFLREVDFLARMRHRHYVDLRYHIVADAVLRFDFWTGSNLVCLWMPNDYRTRKRGPLDVLGRAGGFRVHDVEFSTTPTGWASVTTVSEEDAAELADRLKEKN